MDLTSACVNHSLRAEIIHVRVKVTLVHTHICLNFTRKYVIFTRLRVEFTIVYLLISYYTSLYFFKEQYF
jgi:hypothetical protein